MKFRIALAQINTTVGDFSGNIENIISAAEKSYKEGARLMLTPELALSGYPPGDLLLRPSFYIQCEESFNLLRERLAHLVGLCVVVGHPYRNSKTKFPIRNGLASNDMFNAASVLFNGTVIGSYLKREIPNLEVLDEKRYFASGSKPYIFEFQGVRFGIVICEDIWHYQPALLSKRAGAQVLLVLNASPYHIHKDRMRKDILCKRIQETGLSIVYVNMVGGQDELVFDGNSIILDQNSQVICKLDEFKEQVKVVDFDGSIPIANKLSAILSTEAQIYRALMLGLKDYVKKNNFSKVLIGLSGGVDSALVLSIAYDSLGANHVHAVMMPSKYTSEISLTDSSDMAKRLGVLYDVFPITPMVDAFKKVLKNKFFGLHEDITEENIQARVRSTLLMALSNKFDSLVLSTSNKSETAIGYCTLYGDMAGGFAVIKDITKTLVYQLCTYRNNSKDFGRRNVIPERILKRPPSAELRKNQKDQDHLPSYEVIDDIIHRYIEEDESIKDIIASGLKASDVVYITHLIKMSEYKRQQSPIGVRITHRAFGKDWRYPVTSKYQEDTNL